MPISNQKIKSGYGILVNVLEEALEVRANSARLEYEDTGLGVNFSSGEFGRLVGIIQRDREQEVFATLIERRDWRPSIRARSLLNSMAMTT